MAKPLFNLPPRSDRGMDAKLAAKAKKRGAPAEVKLSGGGTLIDRIQQIVSAVETHLGYLKDDLILIQDESELKEYIRAAKDNKYISVDTETDGLDPFTNKLAGLCLYTHGQKAAYIPMHHISYVTRLEVPGQLPDAFIREQLEDLLTIDPYIDMFFAKFDMRFLKNQLGVSMVANWDGYLGARLLNENEPSNQLKNLHNKYCKNGEGQAFPYEALFKNLPFTYVPIKSAYLYAANDPLITYELNEFQRQYLDPESEKCIQADLQGVSYVAHNIEMPLIPVTVAMEEYGIKLDLNRQAELHDKYQKILDAKLAAFYDQCEMYAKEIMDYRRATGAACKLSDPINIGSPTQLAILLYDIIGLKPKLGHGKKFENLSARSTGEPMLEALDHPLCETVLKYREAAKMLSTYVDKMPNEINPITRRVHCSFNQLGTDTGRYSSNDPKVYWGLAS